MREVEVGKSPVGYSNLLPLVVDQNISRFDIPMDYALGVGEFEANKHLQNIDLNVYHSQLRPQLPEIGVVDELKDN